MINLIPKEEKKAMIRGFYYRLVVLFFTVIAVSLFIAGLTRLPSFFLSSTKISIAEANLNTQKNEPVPVPDQEALAVMQDLNAKLSIIKAASLNKFSVSRDVLSAIFLKKGSSIKITDITYTSDSTNGSQVYLQGLAPSREVLLSFRQALEDDPMFKQVDLPISNFVKGSDIEFFLKLAPAQTNAK